jgi:hypothetical protein
MRSILLLLSLALAACSANAPTPGDGPGGPGDGPGGPGGPNDGPAPPAEPAVSRTVTLQVVPPPSVEKSGVVFLGMLQENVSGDWSKEGAAPSHHLATEALPMGATTTVDVALHGDLAYFAIIDLDGNTLPTPGEPVGGPVIIDKDPGVPAPPFVIDRVWGVPGGSDAPPAEPAAPPVEGLKRTVRVDTKIKPPFLKQGRILVIGTPGSDDGAYQSPLSARPNFRWASEPVALNWPVELQAEVPESGDVIVLLDLDGGLQASVGDLASKPLLGFLPPDEGAVLEVVLSGPLTEDGEGGDSGDEAPGDEGGSEDP